MKKLSILVFLVAMSMMMVSQTIEKTYCFDNPKITEFRGYQQISFENCMQTAEAGSPSLPYHSVSLLLPQGAEAESIEVVMSDFVEIDGNVNLFPYQPSRTTNDTGARELIKNESVYSSRSVYPKENHGILTTQYKNGFAFAFSSFTPVQYIPATGKVMYARTVNVRVNVKASKADHNAMLWATPSVIGSVKRLAQNPEMIDSYDVKGREVNGYDLLLITSEQYVNDFNEYCEYYNGIGLRNNIITVENIYSNFTGVDNKEKIRNCIIQEYQDNGIMMVVLGGDVDIIPYRGFYCYVTSGGGNQESNDIPADLYYAGLDGTWNDNGNARWGEPGEDDLLPEIGISRMSFKNSTELQNMIHKSLTYQQNPVLGEFERAILAGEHLYDNPESNGSDYLELLIGEHSDNGYTTIGFPEYYEFTRLYEEQGTWSPSALKNAINQGKGYVHHDGHANSGYVAGWYSITNSDFSGANGIDHNYTFFHSQGCDCGAFDEECILEKMVRIQNFAVAVIGNSRYGWFNEGQTEGPGAHLEREMTDAQYNDRIDYLGCTLSESKCETAPWVTAPGQWEEGALRWNFYDIHVLGDGACSPWLGEPFNATVDCPSEVIIGTQSINVTITNPEGEAQKNFRCILFNGDEVLALGYTDENGELEMEIEGGVNTVGVLSMKVTGVNAYPVVKEIVSIPNNAAYVVYNDYSLSNGEEQIEYANDYALNLVMKNVGNVDASNITVTIACDSDLVSFSQTSTTIAEIAGNQSVTLENVFPFHVSECIPNDTKVRFNITCTDGTDTWESYFNAKLYAPALTFVQAELITDNVGWLNPGDNAIIRFTFKNEGAADADNVVVNVYNSHEIITPEQTSWSFDVVEAGAEFSTDFIFALSEAANIGFVYELPFATYVDNGCDLYVVQDVYGLGVGQLMEGFETGNFEASNWQNDAANPWSVVTENAYEGQYCAKSAPIENYQATTLSLTVDFNQEGEISFYYKVSSEENYDKLYFYVDNDNKGMWSGEVGWTNVSFSVSAGTHTLKWRYEKDSSISSGSDCAWIDNIVLPPTSVITGVTVVKETAQSVYPNPANDVLHLEIGDVATDVVIYNSLGQEQMRLDAVSGNAEVNVAELKPGLYFVKMGEKVEKVVIR
ncbi:MAG: C25 family cysteine peptidase [Candidatus Limimorpha sp.]